jgi:hypothetical protein
VSIEEREGEAAAGDVKQRRVLGIPGCLSMVNRISYQHRNIQ